MHNTILLSGLFAVALGAPLVARQTDTEWQPAEGTLATCDSSSDQFYSAGVNLDQGNVLFDDICAAILPGCAYPERLPEGTMCTQTINYKLAEPKIMTQNGTVNFSVTPAQQPEEVAGVFITKAECKGYFQELLLKTNPEGCNKQGLGPGAGTLTVGGTTSLKGTVFGISFV